MHLVAGQARQTGFYNLHGTRYHFLVTNFDQRHLLYIYYLSTTSNLLSSDPKFQHLAQLHAGLCYSDL